MCSRFRGKENAGKAGFVMLEVMMISMVFLVMAASILASSAVISRRAVRQAEKNEAYYAAVAAVRMMAGEILKGEEGEISETAEILGQGMPRIEGVIEIFTSGEMVQVPVIVSSERLEDGCLMIRAEAVEGEQRETASMVLETSLEGTGDGNVPTGKAEGDGK